LFVTGPGHGAPAVLAGLFIEGAISKFDSEYPLNDEGLAKFVHAFSWPGGFPSHVNAETPGCIHEGGELGYALSVSYGSILDSPDLITVCIVGDGESETGPTATAWHSHKWVDPKESGAVLPILHVNGFKISERTLPGMSDKMEMALLYSGLGYQVRFVEYVPQGDYKMGGGGPEDETINRDMGVSFDWAYSQIRKIQHAARSGKPIEKPLWPMIILISPKGWTGPEWNGKLQLVNNFASHQVPLPAARTDPVELAHLNRWLASYSPSTLFSPEPSSELFSPVINSILPKSLERRLGFVSEAYADYKPLDLGDWKKFGYKKGEEVSAMKAIGKFLEDTVVRNPKTFRIFSPDELASNKLDDVFNVTCRSMQWDPETAGKGGRVMEMLSEHTLQGWLQGYTMTGRSSCLPSYEAFLGIIGTMITQYSKFTKMASETPWRKDLASVTYIETSTWTRQEHNGFSHQNPGFIGTVLCLPTHLARVYFPADANTATSVIAHCLRSKNLVNLIVGTKAPSPNFLTIEEAEKHCVAGASIWESYSTDKGVNPDVVLVGIGFELTHEVIAASAILRQEFGADLRVRVINIIDLLILAPMGEHPHALSQAGFDSLFPPHCPVIINYHGYPSQLKCLLFDRPHPVGRGRFHINGYMEQGTTTTPFMMLALNSCSRCDVVIKALEFVVTSYTSSYETLDKEKRHRLGSVVAKAHSTMANVDHLKVTYAKYAIDTQQDHPDIGSVKVLAEG
jgi:xylulose-5-phosphate/fructose-6-phosphate phosphoketolase